MADVETQILAAVERMAAGRQASQAIWTGDDFWTLVDAAGDETYENRVKGTAMTAVDAALAAGGFWSESRLRQWFVLHANYFGVDLELAQTYFDSYLATKGWRIPYEANECHLEALGTRLSPERVFPKGTRVADLADPSSSGMHEFGSWDGDVFTEVDGALDAYVQGAAVLIISDAASITGTLEATATLQDGETTVDIAFTQSASEHGQVLLGEAAIGVGGAAADQADVLIKTAVDQFAEGEWVLITKADGSVQEMAQIASIDSLTLTMEDNLLYSWLEDDLVLPLFTDVTRKSGTAGDVVLFYAYPDRIIAL